MSVDIDLNYIGAVDREGMLADRPKIEQALHAVCGRVGVQPRRVPSEHAGGKWRLNFNGAAGGASTLEMDVNFLLRTPLWPMESVERAATPLGWLDRRRPLPYAAAICAMAVTFIPSKSIGRRRCHRRRAPVNNALPL